MLVQKSVIINRTLNVPNTVDFAVFEIFIKLSVEIQFLLKSFNSLWFYEVDDFYGFNLLASLL